MKNMNFVIMVKKMLRLIQHHSENTWQYHVCHVIHIIIYDWPDRTIKAWFYEYEDNYELPCLDDIYLPDFQSTLMHLIKYQKILMRRFIL